MALVQRGNEQPINLNLSNGRGNPLPQQGAAGQCGRMLSYGNVTDLVNHAKEQQELATPTR